MSIKIGILLTNLGTPDAPTKTALKRYLSEFLSDSRVINPSNWMKKILWKLLLHGVVLRTRPEKSAKNYAKIWNSVGVGSPLLSISKSQLSALQKSLKEYPNLVFALGMRYGNPSISSALQVLKSELCDKLIILPLYPQKSNTTTLSTLDAVNAELKTWHKKPEIVFIDEYHQHADYIQALANSVIKYQAIHGKPNKLIMSFHGMPQQYIDNGDVYYQHCVTTSTLLAEALHLDKNAYVLSFQSIFGREKWIEPYTENTLKLLGATGTGYVQVICPGFAADCLETLEEIEHENKEYFIRAGGKRFSYIKALNVDDDHIKALKNVISIHL